MIDGVATKNENHILWTNQELSGRLLLFSLLHLNLVSWCYLQIQMDESSDLSFEMILESFRSG